MSKYTTGEIAKLTGVSVRTVQYYDDRNILVPSELSEGGRRLYSDDDLKRMHIICFLRDAGLSIKSIYMLLAEEKPESIISLLLNQQEEELRAELAECQGRIDLINGIKKELREIKNFSVDSIGDIAHVMKAKNKLAKMRLFMIVTGVPITFFQWISIILWITNGFWWLFTAWICIAIPWGLGISAYYFRHTAYICPECHNIFKPKIKEAVFAYHTPKMRRLSCSFCGRHGLCVEIYDEQENK